MKTELEIFTELRRLEILEANSAGRNTEYILKLRHQISALKWVLGAIATING